MAAIGLRAVLSRARSWRAPAPEPRWSRTMGTVLSATVQVGGGGTGPSGRSEHPLVLYAYQVDGEVFRGERVRRTGPCRDVTGTIDRYPAGSSVVVWYDPANPGNSALEL